MPRSDRFRLALALTLVLCGLQKAEAQMPAATPSFPDQAPLLPGSAPAAPDSSAGGTGTGAFTDPFSRYNAGSADPFRNPGVGSPRRQGRTGSARTPQSENPGATQGAFGTTRDFSSELGVNELLGPNGPSFQPLSVTDYRLLGAQRDEERQDRFQLRRSAANSRFRLIGPAAREATGADPEVAGTAMGWPAMRQSCPATTDGCRG